MWLVGDVGGTKTSLAIVDPSAGPRRWVRAATLPSRDFPDLVGLVRAFLAQGSERIERACFGVAGPVRAGRVHLTNLNWLLDEQELARSFQLTEAILINDLEAIATAVPYLLPDELHTLNAGQPVPHSAIAVIAPGTGLGEAFLTWDGTRYRAHPSEGGHTDFAPRNALELELLRFLLERFDHVSYERLCSGQGMPNIYAFLKETGRAEEPAWLADRLAGAPDPTPIIVEAALGADPPPICQKALELFVSILGAEAGNLALKTLALGGVYVAGGIPPRILPKLDDGTFLRAFQAKGRLSDIMAGIPVHVVLQPQAPLIGAAYRLM